LKFDGESPFISRADQQAGNAVTGAAFWALTANWGIPTTKRCN
jgi:hypothetical protein